MNELTTVTIEYDNVKVIAPVDFDAQVWCGRCRRESDFISQHAAGALIRVMRANGINLGYDSLHFTENRSRQALVCLNSLVAASGTTVLVSPRSFDHARHAPGPPSNSVAPPEASATS